MPTASEQAFVLKNNIVSKHILLLFSNDKLNSDILTAKVSNSYFHCS